MHFLVRPSLFHSLYKGSMVYARCKRANGTKCRLSRGEQRNQFLASLLARRRGRGRALSRQTGGEKGEKGLKNGACVRKGATNAIERITINWMSALFFFFSFLLSPIAFAKSLSNGEHFRCEANFLSTDKSNTLTSQFRCLVASFVAIVVIGLAHGRRRRRRRGHC